LPLAACDRKWQGLGRSLKPGRFTRCRRLLRLVPGAHGRHDGDADRAL